MQHHWAALALVLALCAATPASVGAQKPDSQQGGRKLGTLGQNYPNPFKPDTFIPFTINDCSGARAQHVVTLRIYNVLAQLVSIPQLHGAPRPLMNMKLGCGEYLGYWDGKVRGGRSAASGVYLYELVVDGQRTSRRMFVSH